jgi:hypothetical protein
MAGVLRCVYLTVEAEYFSASELTNIWGDLPVGQAQKLCLKISRFFI